MIRSLSVLFAALSLAAAVAAQSWDAVTTDNGTLLIGSANAAGGTLRFGCTAPSPEGRPQIETYSNEIHQTAPYEMLIGVYDPLFDWPLSAQIDGAAIYLGATGYRLPPIQLDEFSGTVIRLSMTDPMVLALFAAPSLVLDTGQGTAYEYPVAGLGPALRTAFGHCAARWSALGAPVPPSLQTHLAAATAPAAYGPAPQFPHPDTPPPIIDAHFRALCQGDYSGEPEAVEASDIDGDGLPDYLVNWTGITCYGGMQGRAFCGAANCRIDLFASSRGYANPSELLGISASFVQDSHGRIGVLLSGTPFICADGFCDTPWYWANGTLAQ